MLVLVHSHDTPGSSLSRGSFGYADGTGSLLGSFTTFGSAATAFNGEDFTRLELRATGPGAAPEPAPVLAAGSGVYKLSAGRRAGRGRPGPSASRTPDRARVRNGRPS
jgi:hypothetical protein